MVGLIVVCGAALGVLALFALILSNAKTRIFGVSLLATGLVVVAALMLIQFTAPRQEAVVQDAQARVRADETVRAELAAEVATDAAFDELTTPSIDLTSGSDDAEDNDAGGDTANEDLSAQDTAIESDRARPAWLKSGADPKPGVNTAVLYAGPHVTRRACEEEVDGAILEWVKELLASENQFATIADVPDQLGLSGKELRELVVRDRYYETIDSSVATGMQRLCLLVELDEQDAKQLADRISQKRLAIRRESGLWTIGGVAGGVLATLGLALGVLKLGDARHAKKAKTP